MRYAVKFEAVEHGPPYYAGDAKDGPGIAPTLATAKLFDDREVAEQWARNVYGPSMAEIADVIEVDE